MDGHLKIKSFFCIFSAFFLSYPAKATDPLSKLSLEELLSLEVVSAGRKPQRWLDTPAAVYVLTNADIKRSGVTSVPEALRLVPGVEVSRLNAHTWAISARGFNSVFANKLQVLIDGRSIYTPLFSGVYWELAEIVLDDIDRIEVIRGPGAASWGANAVNGVINIITRASEDSQGVLVKTVVGNQEDIITARYGGAWSNTHHFRMFTKYRDQKDQMSSPNADGYHIGLLGYRDDWQFNPANQLTFQGMWYDARELRPLTLAVPQTKRYSHGGSLVASWQHKYSEDSVLTVRSSYTGSRSEEARDDEDRDTLDFDAQHRLHWNNMNEIVWGGAFRRSKQKTYESLIPLTFNPPDRTDFVYSVFFQNDTTLVKDKWHVFLNARAEHYSTLDKIEWQPGAQLLFTPDSQQAYWASVTRAVRVPSISALSVNFDRFSVLPAVGPLEPSVDLRGNPDQQSEKLTAWQLGYRHQLTAMNYDLSLFYHDYSKLLGVHFAQQPQACYAYPEKKCIANVDNESQGKTYGFELSLDWQVRNWWKLKTTYAFLKVELNYESDDTLGKNIEHEMEGSDPKNTFNIRSQMDLAKNVQFDLWWHFQDNLPQLGVRAFNRFDARLAWQATPYLQLSLVGHNIFDKAHLEFKDTLTGLQATEIKRAVYLQLRLTDQTE